MERLEELSEEKNVNDENLNESNQGEDIDKKTHEDFLKNYDKIRVQFVKTVYKSTNLDGSTWSVSIFKLLEDTNVDDQTLFEGEEISATGINIPEAPIAFNLFGKWKPNNKSRNGLTFEVELQEEIIERTKYDIVSYLSVIKGVGPTIAERIYEKFGDETLDILDNDPFQLLEIHGIGEAKFESIITSYSETRSQREVIMALVPYGVSVNVAVRFVRDHGTQAMSKFKKNPYVLVKYIGFVAANEIAIKRETPLNARLSAAMMYLLNSVESGFSQRYYISGSQCLDKEVAMFLVESLLKQKISIEDYNNALPQMKKDGIVEETYKGKTYLYRKVALNAETNVAEKIISLLSEESDKRNQLAVAQIPVIEEDLFRLSGGQEEAVMKSLYNNFSVITGGPGTGKTTIINFIVKAYERVFPKNDIILLAPTGKAARRMTDSTMRPAQTIHSALQFVSTEDGESVVDTEEDLFENSLIVVDEVSMLDIYLAESLFRAVGEGCKLVLVGDVDQLPSVKSGNVLKDIIQSGVVPTTKLTEVYRQASSGPGSTIALNAQLINKGYINLDYADDYRHIETNSFEEAQQLIVDTYVEAVKSVGIDEVCLLTPFRRNTATGVNTINPIIQEKINPPKRGVKEIKFGFNIYRVGDKIMQTKNTKSAVNGDIGYIIDIQNEENLEELIVKIKFKDVVLDYNKDDLENTELAYATTVHKSQGSEYKIVIFNLMDQHKIMLKRNLLYTGITRAKNYLVMVGNRSAVNRSIVDNTSLDRFTLLKERLQGLI